MFTSYTVTQRSSSWKENRLELQLRYTKNSVNSRHSYNFISDRLINVTIIIFRGDAITTGKHAPKEGKII
jgi:hypothetical protein